MRAEGGFGSHQLLSPVAATRFSEFGPQCQTGAEANSARMLTLCRSTRPVKSKLLNLIDTLLTNTPVQQKALGKLSFLDTPMIAAADR